MPLTKEEVRAKLTEMGIKFEVMEHGPVYTIDEMKLIEGMKIEDVCKNLFLRDDRGKRHFLVVLDEAKSADLKAIRAQIGSSRLSFASEDRLMAHLGLIKGAVTPLGVLNDCAADVEVLMDETSKSSWTKTCAAARASASTRATTPRPSGSPRPTSRK